MARASENWSEWSRHVLTGPDFIGPESQHDRRRWTEEGILSIAVSPIAKRGFVILDMVPPHAK